MELTDQDTRDRERFQWLVDHVNPAAVEVAVYSFLGRVRRELGETAASQMPAIEDLRNSVRHRMALVVYIQELLTVSNQAAHDIAAYYHDSVPVLAWSFGGYQRGEPYPIPSRRHLRKIRAEGTRYSPDRWMTRLRPRGSDAG